MKSLMCLPLTAALVAAVTYADSVEARHFWQMYGSVTSDGACGCTWNVNQDYFVPRYSDSGRYDLFSPCKRSCTSSPAAKRCHPHHPGYCTNYGPWHYHRRNHIYGCYCGCGPVNYRCGCSPTPYCGPWLYGSRRGCGANCGGGLCGGGCCLPIAHLMPAPNLEPAGMQVLGGLPIAGDELLASMSIDLEAATQPSEEVTEPTGILPTFGIPSE